MERVRACPSFTRDANAPPNGKLQTMVEVVTIVYYSGMAFQEIFSLGPLSPTHPCTLNTLFSIAAQRLCRGSGHSGPRGVHHPKPPFGLGHLRCRLRVAPAHGCS